MMNKLFLTGIAALLLATGAALAAVKLNNKEIMGDWCFGPDAVDGLSLLFQTREETDCGSFISIQLDGIKSQYEEGGCTATAIKTRYDPTIATATKSPTGVLSSQQST
jgi:hypothetical protein